MKADEREFLEMNFKAIRAEMKADRDTSDLKLDKILGHNERQNGHLEELDRRVEKNTTWRVRIVAVGTFVTGAASFVLGWLALKK